MTRLTASHTGQAPEKVAADMERDFFLSAEEAKAYGLVDAVLVPRRTPERAAA